MEKKPLISVIIPTYNRGNTLQRTIESVLNQTYKNFEILIVDDASTDNTADIVMSIKDARIKYFRHQKNFNGAVARNTGINKSSGQFIAFLDSDDEWLPTKLEVQYNFLNNFDHHEKMVCYTSLIENNGINSVYMPKRGKKNNESVAKYLFVKRGLMQTSTLMMHRSILEKVKFDPVLIRHQDWDLCLQLEQKGYNFVFLNIPLTIRHNEYNRNDRITLSKNYNFSIYWINKYKGIISKRSETAFMIWTVAPRAVFDWDKRRLFKLLLKTVLYRAASFKHFIFVSSYLLPDKIRKKIIYMYRKLLKKH